MIHLTGITPALSDSTRALCQTIANKAREEGIFLSFDPNLRPQLWPSREVTAHCLHELAAQCDLFLPGVAEGTQLAGITDPAKIAAHYRALGAKNVVVKVGGKGAYYDSATEGCAMVPGFSVSHVVDTWAPAMALPRGCSRHAPRGSRGTTAYDVAMPSEPSKL